MQLLGGEEKRRRLSGEGGVGEGGRGGGLVTAILVHCSAHTEIFSKSYLIFNKNKLMGPSLNAIAGVAVCSTHREILRESYSIKPKLDCIK